MLCLNKFELENTQLNNNFLNTFDIVNLWDKWLYEVENINEPIVKNITVEEIRYFYKILSDIFTAKDKNFIFFYIDEIIKRYGKDNKNYLKIDVNNIIDKYITNKIKHLNVDVYNKYIIEKTRYGYINHKQIILLIDEYILPPENDGAFNIMYLEYRDTLTNINFISALYKCYLDPEKTLNEYKNI